jgi:tRNA (guanine37-N1)-methyltransferase
VGQRLVIRFDCVTIFPEMFVAVTQSGITRRALEEKRWEWQGWNPRDFAENAWRTVDDRPYGGGPGMLMQPGPLVKKHSNYLKEHAIKRRINGENKIRSKPRNKK